MPTTIPAGHRLEGKADLILLAGETLGERLTGIDAGVRRIARCAGACGIAGDRFGLVWRQAAGATLRTVRCPFCDGPLRQTTGSFRGRFYRLTDSYVRQCVTTSRAASKARTDELLAAGAVKPVAELAPGDVIRHAGDIGRVTRILGAGAGRTGYKTRIAVEVELTADAVAKYPNETRRTFELPAKGTVNLFHDPDRRFAEDHAGEVILTYARRRADMLRRHAASSRTLRSAWAQDRADLYDEEADEYAAIAELLEAVADVEVSA